MGQVFDCLGRCVTQFGGSRRLGKRTCPIFKDQLVNIWFMKLWRRLNYIYLEYDVDLLRIR
jgi:hypothetical protein